MNDLDRLDHDPPRRSSRLQNCAIGMALGSLAAIVGMIAIVVASRGKELRPITFEILDAAVGRWLANGPSDYDMDLEMTGVNPSIVHVEVRHGNVTAMTMNDRPTKTHTWDEWSVPGLFSIIRRDLEVCMAPRKANASANGQVGSASPPTGDGSGEAAAASRSSSAETVVPRGLFDPKFGYPIQYHRVTPTGADAKWRITKFTPQ